MTPQNGSLTNALCEIVIKQRTTIWRRVVKLRRTDLYSQLSSDLGGPAAAAKQELCPIMTTPVLRLLSPYILQHVPNTRI